MPSNVTGTLRGIFHNDQTSNTGYNGYYRFDFSVAGPGSWAADVGATWGAEDYVPSSFWAAPEAVAPPVTVAPVPGPGKLALLGLSLVLAGMAARRQGARTRTGRLR